MFDGPVKLIKKNKLIHVGFMMNGYLVSGCNLEWNIKAEVSEGNSSEVTCKRCRKLLERADEDGCVILNAPKSKS